MKPKIYLDTSVISALFDTRTPERMAMTEAAWKRLNECDVFLSATVIEELNNATQPLREKMLEAVEHFIVLPIKRRTKRQRHWQACM